VAEFDIHRRFQTVILLGGTSHPPVDTGHDSIPDTADVLAERGRGYTGCTPPFRSLAGAAQALVVIDSGPWLADVVPARLGQVKLPVSSLIW